MDWRKRISASSKVCHGQTCIKGTRVPVSVVLDNVAAGHSPERIVASYPSLKVQDVVAAITYAAEVAHSARRISNGRRTNRQHPDDVDLLAHRTANF